MHTHHMIPSYGTYFGELLHEREDPYYQVSLTVEGHYCQHEILWRAFGHPHDRNAMNILGGILNMDEEARERKRTLAGKGKPNPTQVAAMQEKAWASTRKPVVLIKLSTNERTEYISLREAARAIEGSASALCNVLKGHRKSHLGYSIEYLG